MLSIEQARTGSAQGWPLVLYYHHVHPSIQHYTSLTPQQIEASLELALRHMGSAIDPAVLHAEKLGNLPSSPSILVTFDDGYLDNINYALPILTRLGIRAIFFVVTGKMGQSHSHNPVEQYMTWQNLESLCSMGHVIGSHTVSHAKLPILSEQDIHYQVHHSIETIEHHLGIRPVHFAYPYGLTPSASLELPKGTLTFGTVKARARPWSDQIQNIRRTYFPTDAPETWLKLCRKWRAQWFASQ